MATISRRSAFTLIELLVVIGIILIATSVLFIGGGGGGDGIKLSSAQRIVSSIAQGARGQAILKNATTRLIIYTDSDTNLDDEKKLRYFGIIYLQEDDTETVDEDESGWLAATQGTFLPEGIYFNKDLGVDVPTATMNLNYPRISVQAEGSGDGAEEYFYYEFNRNGTMATGFDNSWLALQAGQLRPDAEDPSKLVVDFDGPENENLKAALIFRRVGTTTMVTDPDEITENN